MPSTGKAVAFPAPEVHACVTVQAEFLGDGPPLATSFGPGVNRYAVRHATFEVVGEVSEYVEYTLEAGVATCTGGGQLLLMEGGVHYRVLRHVRLGIMKGHILRGFDLRQECVAVLTAEKPLWALAFSPCHPIGAVCDFELDMEGHMALEGQLAYLNGAASTLDEEHDANVGLVFHTPLEGLSVAGYYNDVELDLGYSDDWEQLHGNGYRAGIGIDCQTHSAFLRGEYYAGKGFARGVGMGEYETSVHPEDHEMRAYYVEGAYLIATGFQAAPYVQPYARYQVWDRASNGPEDLKSRYATVGITMGLGDGDSSLRLDYETPTSVPAAAEEEASRLVVRLQAKL
ncbi:MAG: hypothetical protein KAY32_08040 [Candidatus Eisenbacteria sp.]|nr:hypothetical protein [Candidatus Eisenbacteria bacterium]